MLDCTCLVGDFYETEDCVMNIGQSISKILRMKKIPRKALVADRLFTDSRLTRIVTGRTEASYKEIAAFCEYIGISLNEFNAISKMNEEEYLMNLKYRKYVPVVDEDDIEDAQTVIDYFREKKYQNLNSFLMYLRTENFITPNITNKPFSKIDAKDIIFITSRIGNSKMLTGVEIYILAGTMLDLPYDYVRDIYLKYFPISYEYIFSVGEEERKAIIEFLNNFFDRSYMEHDFDLAKDSLDLVTEFLGYFSNLRFMLMEKMNRLFLKMTEELDRNSIDEIRVYVEALHKIGDHHFANSVESQLDDLLKRTGMVVSNEKMRSD